MTYRISRHAQCRMQQRGGLRSIDLELILTYGTPVQDGVQLTAQDVDEMTAQRKAEICHLERLRGMFVPMDGNTVLSVYKPGRNKQRHLRRRKRIHTPRRPYGPQHEV